MMELQAKQMSYVETIAKDFPHTLFAWCFKKQGEEELKWTSNKTYNNVNLTVFWRKANIFRGALWNHSTDELRLDYDYSDMQDNITAVTKTITRLEELGIKKYLVYATGGKGLHIHFRYNFVFKDYDRADVRHTLFNKLDLNIAVDNTLFRTGQILGLESFKHRKTMQHKQLITITNNEIQYLNYGLEFDYLTDSYVNTLNDTLVNDVLHTLDNIDKPKNTLKINSTPPAFYKSTSFDFFFNRFIYMYFHLEGFGTNKMVGGNRTQDMFIRYVYLTVKNEELTRYYFKLFCDSVGLSMGVEKIIKRVQSTINSMTANAIFIYPEIFTKEYFFETYIKEANK